MDDYKKMYYTLFNKITDLIYELQIIQRTTESMCPRPDPETETAGEAHGQTTPPRSQA